MLGIDKSSITVIETKYAARLLYDVCKKYNIITFTGDRPLYLMTYYAIKEKFIALNID